MAVSGKGARDKGARIEREMVSIHDAIPCAAEKISRSGYEGTDLRIADTFTAEVKARREGIKTINKWLGCNDLLFIREDHNVYPKVVMPWRVYRELLAAWLCMNHEDYSQP